MSAKQVSVHLLTAAVVLATGLASLVGFLQFDGMEALFPEWAAWRRFFAVLAFGLGFVGTSIAMIFAVECLIAAGHQRTLRPVLAPRVDRYPTIASWCVALAGLLGIVLSRSL